MTANEFLAGLTGSSDEFQILVEALRASGQPFCLIGRLGINHYVEPMVTLDADFAIAGSAGAAEALRSRGFEVEEHPHSINARHYSGSRCHARKKVGRASRLPRESRTSVPLVETESRTSVPLVGVLKGQAGSSPYVIYP